MQNKSVVPSSSPPNYPNGPVDVSVPQLSTMCNAWQKNKLPTLEQKKVSSASPPLVAWLIGEGQGVLAVEGRKMPLWAVWLGWKCPRKRCVFMRAQDWADRSALQLLCPVLCICGSGGILLLVFAFGIYQALL